MRLSLSRDSDVPLRQQIAEQIVFHITTGQLRVGQRLPSVRTLARQLKVHHNTVSEAYQDLVRRSWLARKRGSRLVVGTSAVLQVPANLDDLIGELIERASRFGYSFQAVIERVRAHILIQPPDRILIVEEEAGLRRIIRGEIQARFNWRVDDCSPQTLASEPQLALGAQIVAPGHLIEGLRPLIPGNRPAARITYSAADEEIALIRGLRQPSIVAAVSISESALKTARSLFAPAIGRRHSFRAILLSEGERINLKGVDAAFCDSVTMPLVACRQKLHYRLISANCLGYLASSVRVGSSRA